MKTVINDILSVLYCASITKLTYNPCEESIFVEGIDAYENNIFHLNYFCVGSFFCIKTLSNAIPLNNTIDELGIYNDDEAKKASENNAIQGIKNLTPRFYFATSLFRLLFDAKKITLNGEVIYAQAD